MTIVALTRRLHKEAHPPFFLTPTWRASWPPGLRFPRTSALPSWHWWTRPVSEPPTCPGRHLAGPPKSDRPKAGPESALGTFGLPGAAQALDRRAGGAYVVPRRGR